jgi:Domain of unknown function (DUF932)
MQQKVSIVKKENTKLAEIKDIVNKKFESLAKERNQTPATKEQIVENKAEQNLKEFKALKKLEDRDLRKFEMLADFTNANTEYYKKWGVMDAKLYYIGTDGITPTYSDRKGYFKFHKDPVTNQECSTTQAFKRTVSPELVIIPQEEAFERIDRGIQNFNKSDQAKIFGKFELKEDYEAHKLNGNYFTHYWQYLSDKQYDVEKGDTVQFGFSFRNGIGTRVSLGGDIYSYRLSCSNGAVCRDAKIGSFNIPHIISAERMMQKFTDALANTIENYKKLLDYYKAFNVKRLDQQLVDQILKKVDLPLKYLPEDILEIVTNKKNKELEEPVIIFKKDSKATLWDLFNGITQPLTKSVNETTESKRIAYNIFSKRTTKLHRAMMPLVQI